MTYNNQCQDCRSRHHACTTHGGSTPSWVYDTTTDDTADSLPADSAGDSDPSGD